MNAEVFTYFQDEGGQAFYVGNTVTIKLDNGGGMGGCTITKVTKTGFHYRQGIGKEKNIQFANIKELG